MKKSKKPPPAKLESDVCKIQGACDILDCSQSRVYEVLQDKAREDPENIIETFIWARPGAKKGTRLFRIASLRRYMEWLLEQSRKTVTNASLH